MEINKKELKKLDLAFRTISSRMINANFEEASSILKMFVEFIDNKKLISEYIDSIIIDDFNVEEAVEEAISQKPFNTGGTAEEEIGITYKILKFIVENDISLISIGRAYSDSSKYQDMIKSVGSRLILPFVNHIEMYIFNISIDMGIDDEVFYKITNNVTVSGSAQVNLAQNSATINAIQKNGINQDELNMLVEKILATIPETMEEDERVTICDSVKTIQEELKSESPKKRLIRLAKNALDKVAPKITGSVEFAASITTLYQFIQPLFL